MLFHTLTYTKGLCGKIEQSQHLWIHFLCFPSGHVPVWVPKAAQLAEHGDVSDSAGFSFPFISQPAVPWRIRRACRFPTRGREDFWEVVIKRFGKTDTRFLFPHSSLSCVSRSQSSGRLSDMLLMAAFGGQLGDRGSTENLSADRAIDIAG